MRIAVRVVGLAGKVSGPSACERYPQHQVYPYLRRRAAVIEGYSRGCCHGGFPIPWMRVFAWTACKTPWASLVRPTCPTPTRVRNFPATPSRWFCLDAGIAISRDRRVRVLDNIFVERLWRTVKDEDVDLGRPQGLRQPAQVAARADRVLRLLQRRKTLPGVGKPHA